MASIGWTPPIRVRLLPTSIIVAVVRTPIAIAGPVGRLLPCERIVIIPVMVMLMAAPPAAAAGAIRPTAPSYQIPVQLPPFGIVREHIVRLPEAFKQPGGRVTHAGLHFGDGAGKPRPNWSHLVGKPAGGRRLIRVEQQSELLVYFAHFFRGALSLHSQHAVVVHRLGLAPGVFAPCRLLGCLQAGFVLFARGCRDVGGGDRCFKLLNGAGVHGQLSKQRGQPRVRLQRGKSVSMKV